MNDAHTRVVIDSSATMPPDPCEDSCPGPISGSDVPTVNFLHLDDTDSDAGPEDDGYELLNANELDNYDDEEIARHNQLTFSQTIETTIHEPSNTRFGSLNDVELRPTSSDSLENNKPSCELSPDESEIIKNVMKGIKLPESAVPSWASVIPEDRWKGMLDSKIKGKSTCPSSSSDSSTESEKRIEN